MRQFRNKQVDQAENLEMGDKSWTNRQVEVRQWVWSRDCGTHTSYKQERITGYLYRIGHLYLGCTKV